MTRTGTVFVDEVVRLADLFTVEDTLVGYSFENCLLVGPGVVLFTGRNVMEHCTFMADPVGSIWPLPAAQPFSGQMHFHDSEFQSCRFVRLGFTGDDEFIESFQRGAIAP